MEIARVEGWRGFAFKTAALAAGGGVALSGCSSGESEPTPFTTTTTAAETTLPSPLTLDIPTTLDTPTINVPTTLTPPTLNVPTTKSMDLSMTFDDLGGGSSIIKVYPGPSDSAADQKHSGTFIAGDGQGTVYAECKTPGRLVKSVPSVGERELSSNIWIRFNDGAATNLKRYFATVVYVTGFEQFAQQLPDC